MARDPLAVEVREPPAFLLVVGVAVLIGGAHERDAEEALRYFAAALATFGRPDRRTRWKDSTNYHVLC